MATHCLVFSLTLIAASNHLPDWTDFRGPTHQGWATDAESTPVEWDETKNVLWKTPIPGRGWSTPVIADGLIWLTTATDDGHSLRVIAVDDVTGEIVKNIEVFAPKHPVPINAKNSHSSPSPVLDDKCVYVHFGVMGTACIDRQTGEVLWRNTDLVLDHKEGPGSSPILWNGHLILTCDGMDIQYLAALDARTGKLLWRQERPQPIHPVADQCKAYSTPLVISTETGPELISPGAMQVLAYDPATGKEKWRVKYSGFSNVPRPVFGNGLVYVCTGYMKPQLWAIRPGGTGDVTDSHVVWKYDRQVPAGPSPILVDDSIYIVSNNGILTCLDAITGKARWAHRLGGNFSASPIFAGGRLYFCSEEGMTTVVSPGTKFQKLAENEIDGMLMASPIAVGDSLILRSDKALYRIREK